MTKSDKLSTAKAIIALLIVILAGGIYFLFNENKDMIMQSDMLKQYVLLIILGMGLLVGLFYLVSNSTPSVSRVGKTAKVGNSVKKKKKSSR